MSRRSPERAHQTDMNAANSESCSFSSPMSVENEAGPLTAARLQTIHELVRTNGYDVPAMLVAERIVARAMSEKRDHGD